MTGCLTCRVRKKACSKHWHGGSCTTCIGLGIPCVGGGRKPPSWFKNTILPPFCRRIISEQIKERRKNKNRARRYSPSTPSVREVVTALIGDISALYPLNHIAYDHDFCAITFLDEITGAVGIPFVESRVQGIASVLGYPLLTAAAGPTIDLPYFVVPTPAAHVSQPPSPPPFVPFDQPSSSSPFHVADTYASDHQASLHTPTRPLASDHYHTSQLGFDFDSRGLSTSALFGPGDSDQGVNVPYGCDTVTESRQPASIGPSFRQTLDDLASFFPTQLPTLRRVIFEIEDEDGSTERALHEEFARVNSIPGMPHWARTEFEVEVVRRGRGL